MTQPDHHDDQRFDELLRDIGPDVPRPTLDDDARARLMASIEGAGAHPARGPAARSRGRMRLVAAAATGLAAVLGLSCVLLWARLGCVEDRLATSRWETEEVLQLLMRARHTQRSIPIPQDLEGLSSSDLVLITFHHDLCPVARVCTPGFQAMEKTHAGAAARFITFDVTGSRRDLVVRALDALDMRYALAGPPGAETGVVKVLDTRRQRVLCAALGEQGLEQAELLLSRVQGDRHQH